MCDFIYTFPPSCKWFDTWDVKHLLSLLEGWALGSSLTNFKLVLKMASFSAFVTVKKSGLTLLCTDNQYLFHQCNGAIFIPASG